MVSALLFWQNRLIMESDREEQRNANMTDVKNEAPLIQLNDAIVRRDGKEYLRDRLLCIALR